ncbi:hypothetical protein H7A76_30320 [Pseudomonas sp. MSSRFD41]|uniref:hypothetical protein n=1 Tax=Pseudomonas sp. MSSRFD41 TaxID=1310370 RepID=UPI00163A11A8|nr:hypothetical protein [Pseudomonas sp. MSSRFD41]MBC2659750.1 hypothetical protein [Pseudomonas sp. MSSRFD41]
MAFEYTPLTPQNLQRQRDQYQPFQSRQTATGQAQQPNLMQLAKTVKGLGAVYNSINGGTAAGSAQIGGTGYGLGQSLQAGELGSSTYAGSAGAAGSTAASGSGSAVSGGTAAGSAGSAGAQGAGSTFGSVLGGLNMAKDVYGIGQGMQTPQGVEGRDKGTFMGSAAAAGQGAAGGASVGGPIGAIVGAALGNESYQWQHGNRKSLTSLGGLLKSELTGGLAARDIGSWTGLWE